MNHIFKYSTNHTFSAFSKKYNEAPFQSCILTRQSFSRSEHLGYSMDENVQLKRNDKMSQKTEEGYKTKLKKTDLLKVTKTSATQKQMTIGKLKPSHIMAFANQPGMVLQKFHESTPNQNLKMVKMGEHLKESSDYVPNGSITHFMTRRIRELRACYTNPFHTEWKVESDFRYKLRFWVAYTDVCLNGNLSPVSLNVMLAHKGHNLPYETILVNHSQGRECISEQMFNELNPANLIENRKLTVLYLDCLSRSNLDERVKVERAEFLIDLFLKRNSSLDVIEDIIGMYFLKDALVLLQKACPHFRGNTLLAGPPYNCPLVERLYKDGKYKVSPSHPKMTKEDLFKLAENQICLEKSVQVEIDSILRRHECVRKPDKQKWKNLLNLWREKFRESLLACLERMETDLGMGDLQIYPFLNCLPVDDMVEFMISEAYSFCLKSDLYTNGLISLYRTIGENLWLRYNLENRTKKGNLEEFKEIVKNYMEWYHKPKDSSDVNYRQKWAGLMWETTGKSKLNELSIIWTEEVTLRIGRFISQLVFKSAMIPSTYARKSNRKYDVPAFYIVYRFSGKKYMTPQVKIHPSVRDMFASAKNDKLLFDVKSLPMLCPPKPWTSTRNGGLYLIPARFLRYTEFNYSEKVLNRFPNKELYSIFDSLNQLQSVAWVLNTKVLDVAIKVFKSGGSEELGVPVNPNRMSIPKRGTGAMYYAHIAALQKKSEAYSLWCECLYKLSLANHLRDKMFWLPHNLDFRGRIYPISPHVNHICADLYRSLYLFAEKKPLGSKGLDWLMIHCINLRGTHKKNSTAERLAHAKNVLMDILDSAENPLNGRRWWAQAEDPWQTLAVCMEIRNAVISKNPKTYETGFPVHQDGSCNGLQHYAALGRDPIGAASVNLAPSEYPQDVYEVVVNIVEGLRKKDMENGLNIAQALEGYILRKVLKQTVMTSVYGVTMYGAKLQIANKLKNFKDFPPHLINPGAIYLARKVFQALKEMFTSAQELQSWFSSCAKIITSEMQKHVTWVTPLGLPVTQPYFHKQTLLKDQIFRPSARKQRNAFAANFIHSLDSSHLMLTGLACGMNDITFASVHDCYWTHPVDVDRMNVICRAKFIELHSEDIIGNLSRHFIQNYIDESNPEGSMREACIVFKSIPKKGEFDLNDVAKSTYFFS